MIEPDALAPEVSLTDLTATEALSLMDGERLDPEVLWREAESRADESSEFNALTFRLAREASDIRGPLRGIPVVVKGNIDVRDVPTTAGTPGLIENIATADAPVVRRLRDAGARPVAVTVMHELALGATSNNAMDGAPRNPWNPSMISGGSSGGTAAAVALGIAPIGIGTDTGGSVRVPAALCGIYGFRPTIGRYPGTGIFSLSPTRDTAGPMARSIDDILLADRVLASRRRRNTRSADASPSDIVVGVSTSHLADLDPDVGERFERTVELIVGAGFRVIDVNVGEIVTAASEIAVDIVWGEAETSLSDYLSSRSGPQPRAVFSGVTSPDVKALLDASLGSVSAEHYEKVVRTFMRLRENFGRAMDDAAADVVLFPTTPVVAPPIGDDDTLVLNGRAQPTFATIIRHSDLGGTIGLPGISVPVGPGSRSGLPVGAEFTAPSGADDKLLDIVSRIAPVIAVETRPSALPTAVSRPR